MMWSFGEWLQSKSFFFQIQFDMLFRALPYFVGYFMILGTYASTQPIFPSDTWRAFFMLAQIASPGVLITSVGSLVIENYRRKVKDEARRDKGINMTIWWTPTKAYDEDNVLVGFGILKEKTLKQLKIKHKKMSKKDTNNKQERDFKFKYGKFYYEATFMREMEDPQGGKWKNAVLLADFPSENTFRDVPNQLLSNKGVIFLGPSAKVNLVYCNEFNEVGKGEETGFENYKVFRVSFDPERVYAMQNQLGLKPASVEKGQVEEAAQLSIDHTAMKFAIQKRESDGQLRSYIETHQDSRTRGMASSGKFLENSDFIRKDRSTLRKLRERLDRNTMIIIGIIILFLAWRMGWIG